MKYAAGAFIATLTVFSVFTYAFVDLNLSYLKPLYTGLYLNQRVLMTIIYSILILIIFGCAYLLINNAEKIKTHLLKLIIATVILGILAYPSALSFDIFNYVTTAKVTYYYHENPYIIYPIEFFGDPYLNFTRAANKTALYGPLWIILSSIPYFAGLGNFLLTLYSFKIFTASFYLGTIYLIKKIDEKAVVFFALNPLVIIESLVSSHNDIVMIFFALLSFYFFFRKKHFLSAVSLLGSILIKFSTLFLIPIFFGLIKDRVLEKQINTERAFRYSAIFMFGVFLITPFREELYPWYGTWFIVFTSFLHKNKFLQNIILIFSLGLMLRYIPYMATGSYFGLTPLIRIIFTVFPILLFLLYKAIIQRYAKQR